MRFIKEDKIKNGTILKKRLQKSITLVDATYLWLNSKKNLKIQSYQRYETIIITYIKPFFKDKLIYKINSNDIVLFIKDLQTKLSVSVQKNILYIVKATINYAQKNKWCNYIDLSDIFLKKESNIIRTLSIEEQKRLEDNLKNKINIRKCCLLLCLYTGLRVGEVCGLKWEDINFEAKTMQIKRTIQRIKNNDKQKKKKTILIVSTPKSLTSNRIVPIPKFLIEVLYNLKKESNCYLLSGSEKLYDPRLLEIFYKRILNNSNINYHKFHILRHTFATRAIESKMDVKTLSEILGHSSVDITLKLYVHPSIELKKTSIEQLVDYMNA